MNSFDDWYYEQCAIAAAEIVGPNSCEYDRTVERFYEDELRQKAAYQRYFCDTVFGVKNEDL